MNRREFIGGGVAAGISTGGVLPVLGRQDDLESVVRKASVTIAGHRMAPLYAVAYVDPGIASHQGQETTVARYPIAVVPQDGRTHFRKWRDDVRRLNPRIFLLGYQMTIEETTVPGPGHDKLRQAKDSWHSSFLWPKNPKRRRLYDSRSEEWKEKFLQACATTLQSYPYDGLFLDQCSVFLAHSLSPNVRAEMRLHLGETLKELRRRHPTAILIGNSSCNWEGLNGEMSEHHEERFGQELLPISGHATPNINLGLVKLTEDTSTDSYVRRKLIMTCSHGALFSAALSYQRVPWFPVYDEVLRLAA